MKKEVRKSKCCGSTKLEIVYRTYNDGTESWGYACKCGKIYKESGHIKRDDN